MPAQGDRRHRALGLLHAFLEPDTVEALPGRGEMRLGIALAVAISVLSGGIPEVKA
jgi:hypothetical protein